MASKLRWRKRNKTQYDLYCNGKIIAVVALFDGPWIGGATRTSGLCAAQFREIARKLDALNERDAATKGDSDGH